MVEQLGETRHYLTGGDPVPAGEFEAVGMVGGCTGTLITDELVLTAAHCVCTGQVTSTGCVSRATFTFVNVVPAGGGARTNVSTAADVLVHPNYTDGGWLFNDYAILRLDQPASMLVDVEPIPVESPDRAPKVGDILTLVGFGRTGPNCMSPPAGKRRLNIVADEVTDKGIVFKDTTIYSCPGDSGGPALNSAGHVVGVASHSDQSTNCTYKPTYVAYPWLFGTNEIRRLYGRVTLLRVHDFGTGYGPAVDKLDDVELVVALDSAPGQAFGYPLRSGVDTEVGEAMFAQLRRAYSRGRTVHIEYRPNGPSNARLVRVIAS